VVYLPYPAGLEQHQQRLALFSYSGLSNRSLRATQVQQQKSNSHHGSSDGMWNQSDRYRSRLCVVLLVPAVLCIPAFCVLGQDVSSVASDQARMKASVRVVVANSYSVHEMQTPTGTAVRQFVSPAGTVFAVTWQGFSPDLQQLLGEYFEEYVTAASSQPARRGRGVFIDTGDLVVETGGHMRFAVGRAYLRSKVPQGVDADALR
jgi:hypothetical protein